MPRPGVLGNQAYSSEEGNANRHKNDSSAGGVYNKPQGFREGQLAKRGIFHCFLNCGQTFRSVEEAKNHKECPCKPVLAEEVERLYRSQGQNKILLMKKARVERKDQYTMFRNFLRTLPKIDKDERICEFVSSLPKVAEEEEEW